MELLSVITLFRDEKGFTFYKKYQKKYITEFGGW